MPLGVPSEVWDWPRLWASCVTWLGPTIWQWCFYVRQNRKIRQWKGCNGVWVFDTGSVLMENERGVV
jgi:hypothetical protein